MFRRIVIRTPEDSAGCLAVLRCGHVQASRRAVAIDRTKPTSWPMPLTPRRYRRPTHNHDRGPAESTTHIPRAKNEQ